MWIFKEVEKGFVKFTGTDTKIYKFQQEQPTFGFSDLATLFQMLPA